MQVGPVGRHVQLQGRRWPDPGRKGASGQADTPGTSGLGWKFERILWLNDFPGVGRAPGNPMTLLDSRKNGRRPLALVAEPASRTNARLWWRTRIAAVAALALF